MKGKMMISIEQKIDAYSCLLSGEERRVRMGVILPQSI